MNCPLCGGKLKGKDIDYEKHWGDKIHSFKKVPAFVCENCKDILIPGESAKNLERTGQDHKG